jgi:hypothetical protein
MKKHLIIAWSFTSLVTIVKSLTAQEPDLLKMVGDEKPKKEYVKNAFKSPRVINSQSMEFLRPGTMDFRILHRFGQLNQGYKNFFGLDQATMRMGFDFGLTRNLMIGIGRSTYKKELDAYFKYAPLMQSTGPRSFPFTLALVAGVTRNGLEWTDTTRENFYTSRLSYFFQGIIGRKFSEAFTLQFMSTLVHRNLVTLAVDDNDIYAAGIGGRLKISKRVAFTWDYYYVVNPLSDQIYHNPFSVGVDIETGGHVFQLHLSNAIGMNEKAFITETTGDWASGEIRFGFNLSRVFQLKKKKLG